MKQKDGSTTSPSLLKRVADWADHLAWCDFRTSYDPLIHSWCRGYGLEAPPSKTSARKSGSSWRIEYARTNTIRAGHFVAGCGSSAIRGRLTCFVSGERSSSVFLPMSRPMRLSSCWPSIRLAARKTRSSNRDVRSCCGRPSRSSTPWNKVLNRGPGKPSGGSP